MKRRPFVEERDLVMQTPVEYLDGRPAAFRVIWPDTHSRVGYFGPVAAYLGGPSDLRSPR